MTSDECRSLGLTNAGGQSVDSAHMFSHAQPEQDVFFTDMLMAPPDQGVFDFYTSTSERQPTYSEHMPMMPSKSQPAQKQFQASQEQQPDTAASVWKLSRKTDLRAEREALEVSKIQLAEMNGLKLKNNG